MANCFLINIEIMNKLKYYILPLLLLTVLASCEIEEIDNPNAPTLESVENGASLADIRLLATGLESIIRDDIQFHYWTVSIVGREYWDLNNTDPRYTSELLGASGTDPDNNGFLTSRPFGAAYSTVRQAEVLMTAVANSSASLSTAETNGLTGYAKTMKAYAILQEANRQYENGMRLDTADPNNLGDFLGGYQATLTGIKAILDEAGNELGSAGTDFAIFLSGGFAGFDTPATFLQFNRAIAARVAMYQGNKSAALTALNASFMDMAGDLNMGPAHAFGASGNDVLNPLFYVADQALYTAHPTFVSDAEAGDMRVTNKTRSYTAGPASADGLSGDTQVSLYASNTASIPIIRNEELVLLSAEVNIGSNNTAAVAALNVVRNAAGLANYSGATDDASLVNELLNQRRYSLFGEGHRWIDMRRYNKLGELPIDRAGDKVHVQFPRPVTEG